jgi:membrane protein DedA with SNARE-associated domain
MTAAQLIMKYGYLAIFVGSVVEGETILILAGFAAHQGYLSFPKVLVSAFFGGVLGDQVFFVLGRLYGQQMLARFPSLLRHVEKVNRLILRFHSLVIILVRFMYGLRVAGPIVIGASGLAAWRFVLFNLLGGVVWAVLVGGVGYLFGKALTFFFADIRHYEFLAAVVVAAIGGGLGLAHLLRRRSSVRRGSSTLRDH